MDKSNSDALNNSLLPEIMMLFIICGIKRIKMCTCTNLFKYSGFNKCV